MIYFFYGGNQEKAEEKFKKLLSALEQKKPDASIYKINSLEFNKEEFEGLVRGQQLFEKKYIISCNKLFENKEARDFILENIEAIAESPHPFVFLEMELSKEEIKKIEKYADKTQEFASNKTQEARSKYGEFNIFLLTDALGARDRKKLWTLIEEAKMAGVLPEEIFWKLVWQTKSLLLAQKTNNVKESGLSPFPYKKAVSYSKNFETKELEKMSLDLVSLYHDSRKGITDLDTGLELFALGI